MGGLWKYLITLPLVLASGGLAAQLRVRAGSKRIAYTGRVALQADSAVFYWPGSSATIRFTGTRVTATMRSLREPGYFYAITDGDAAKALRFRTDSNKQTVTLADSLPYGKHSVQLYKLSNSTSANILYGFGIGGRARLHAPAKPRKRRIEFYGNSITAGHGVDVQKGQRDSGAPGHFNNYYTYAALTARHFGAEASYIARSGIGIMVSWFPETMPEVYDRLDPVDSTSKWNFSRFAPAVVVVSLGQNDYWLTQNPQHAQFKARFGAEKPGAAFIIRSYRDFVARIRAKYPAAHIICVLGNMNATEAGSAWPGYIREAVAGLCDNRIHTVVFPYKGTGGHPDRQEQGAMAEALILFIEKTVDW